MYSFLLTVCNERIWPVERFVNNWYRRVVFSMEIGTQLFHFFYPVEGMGVEAKCPREFGVYVEV